VGDRATQLAGRYNVGVDLLGRNLASRPDKIAYIDAAGEHSYRQLAELADRIGAGLLGLGLEPGDRVAVCILDGVDFVAAFLGAIKVGLVPVALNTLLPAEDYAYLLSDSGVRAVLVSGDLLPQIRRAIGLSGWSGELIVSGQPDGAPHHSLASLAASHSRRPKPHPSRGQDIAFWLYSSGSTGRPKGVPHRHASPPAAAELFGRQVLGLKQSDVVYSAAKLFFAYGLGNALFFPMSVGATAVLFPDRVTPEAAEQLLARHKVTVFCAAPTLFSRMLAAAGARSPVARSLCMCVSAGEALPEEIGHAWTARTGVEIVDGIGSTEMLHIFVSNRPGQVRYGTTGRPVPGYEVRLVGEDGRDVGPDEVGELHVRGPTMTAGYWNQPERTAATFVGGWMRTADKFTRSQDGWLTYCGRADDMLKVSGMWVSPSEVENALVGHEAVLEAAVIGVVDAAGLITIKAFIVLKPGHAADEALAEALKAFIKSRLAPHKYPRIIAFVDELPKTATGKVRRDLLRARETAPA
jgi:benzoate-CoA ligase